MLINHRKQQQGLSRLPFRGPAPPGVGPGPCSAAFPTAERVCRSPAPLGASTGPCFADFPTVEFAYPFTCFTVLLVLRFTMKLSESDAGAFP